MSCLLSSYSVAGSCRSRQDGSARTLPVCFGAHLSKHTAFRPLSSSSVLLLRTTLNPEIQLAVGFPVELARQTAPQMSLTSLFLCRLVAYPLIAWQKKLEAMEMSQLTAFENDELLSRDLFANELGLNSDRIATLRTNWDYIATFARRSHECRNFVRNSFAIK